MSQEISTEQGVRRILIACIGNIFFGDDGFGVEVARRLLDGQPFAPDVQVIDFGIRGLDLAYTLLDEAYTTLVLVDTVSRGGTPGTLYLLEPDLAGMDTPQGAETGRAGLDSHSMDPVKVLAFARTLGARLPRVLLVGCEPLTIGTGEEMCMGLSQPVQAAVENAVSMIDSLITGLLDGGQVEMKNISPQS